MCLLLHTSGLAVYHVGQGAILRARPDTRFRGTETSNGQSLTQRGLLLHRRAFYTSTRYVCSAHAGRASLLLCALQLYEHVSPGYDGPVTVPVLYDTVKDTIVNNESSEVIRILNSAFNAYCATPEQAAIDLYPADLRPTIDATNEWVYPNINNGVYRAGFAHSQGAYETAVRQVFEHLDKADAILATQRYMCGDRLTEADVRLFTTLFRFDLAYYSNFKCNLRTLRSYDNLYGLLRELYQRPEFRSTCSVYHVKEGYYWMDYINPTRIVPLGPLGYEEDLLLPHGRDAKFPVKAHL